MTPKNRSFAKYILLPLLILNIAVFPLAKKEQETGLKVIFYDVGQGDAIFIETTDKKQVLLDGGPKRKIMELLPEDMPFFDRSLDLVILSHPHADHVEGLVEVVRHYNVGTILMPEVVFDSAPYSRFLDLIEEKKINTIFARQGIRLWLDEKTVIDVYYPFGERMHADSKAKGMNIEKINPNNTSIVARLTYGKTKFLFTGDAESAVEDMLVENFNLDSDVLKVAHQGSNTSTSDMFLSATTPDYAVISVGKNSYGHPTKQVMDRLSAVGARIVRTDISGTIRFFSDGSTINIK
jgi:competence protein ComEC